jgi:two-component system chemotaxis response regulator CheV
MSGVLDKVDQRTKLVGENRLELLMFKLRGRQTYAINVFKVQEVLKLPNLTLVPHRHPVVCGVTHLRGVTVPVINLSMAINLPALEVNKDSTIIVTEYNRSVQAFLVGGVDRIVNMNWDEIQPPPKGTGRAHYLTAITHYKEEIVEIIDVEKVLAEIVPFTTDISDDVLDKSLVGKTSDLIVLVVDDSPVAMSQAKSTLMKLGLQVVTANNGLEAWNFLKSLAANDDPKLSQLLMMVTDAEMPEMDGYTLVTRIKEDPALSDMFIMLHTSLSGVFNQAMVKKVGADDFMAKFSPDELAERVMEIIDRA